MNENKPVPLMLSIPKIVRDKLRTMAAEQNFQNPDQVTSASTIAREILCDQLSIIANDPRAEQCLNQQNTAA
jgi:hypothetical protein